jgi:hypothetical protein
MYRLAPALAVVLLIALLLPGCTPSGDTAAPEPAKGQVTVDTEFARMLGFVPYSFLEEHDIWFDNWAKAKQLYGLEDIKSIEAVKSLPEDRLESFRVLSPKLTGNRWRNLELAPVVGFDIMMVDRMVFTDIIPPRSFSLSEGDFDEGLIGSKLTGLEYTKMEYGDHTYYGTGEDYNVRLENELSKMVLNGMNCLAVFDNTIIAAPASKYITGMFDARDRTVPSIADNDACRALADSLGDVLTAVMMTPERIIITDLRMQGIPKFDFNIPDDWGLLHQFDMAAAGYRDDGEKGFMVIALYYQDESAAKADGAMIIKRMKTYTLGTLLPKIGKRPFTEKYIPGEPAFKHYPGGVVLTIACQLIPEEHQYVSMDMGAAGMGLRDLLFLAPDPSVYVAE